MTNNFISKEELIKKFKNIELVCLDVDGILTDGTMYLDNNNVATRKFYAHDGTGIQMIKHIGVKVALVTTGTLELVSHRAKILQIQEVILGSHKKGEDIKKLCDRLGVSIENTLHIGDDVNDISAFQKVGFPITAANAVEAVLPYCIYQTEKKGGEGAVREICDLILLAKTGKLYGEPYVKEFVQ